MDIRENGFFTGRIEMWRKVEPKFAQQEFRLMYENCNGI
jgi:hypothetical protein